MIYGLDSDGGNSKGWMQQLGMTGYRPWTGDELERRAEQKWKVALDGEQVRHTSATRISTFKYGGVLPMQGRQIVVNSVWKTPPALDDECVGDVVVACTLRSLLKLCT